MTYSNIAKAFVAAGFVLGGVTASYAQGPGGLVDNLANNMGFIGETNTMGPNCPPMEVQVVP